MRIFTEAAVAAVVCFAAVAAIFALHPFRTSRIDLRGEGKTAAVLAVSGEAQALEQAVRALISCPAQGGIKYDLILIADCGLSPAGRKIAELLANGDERIMLCTPDGIGSAVLSEEFGWTESVSTIR